jgi:hypothetical protein
MTPEAAIQHDILLALTERCGGVCTVWRQNTGAARLPGKNGAQQLVRFGVPGQADISGLFHGSGRRLEIEVKAPGGRQSASQKRFERVVRSCGGVYLLVDNTEDAVAGVLAAAQEP